MNGVAAIALKVVPILVEINRPQVEQSLSTSDRPAHASPFKAVFDQVAAGPLNHPSANGPAQSQVTLIVHVGQIAPQVVEYLFQGFALVRPQARPGLLALQMPEQAVMVIG